MFKNPRGCNPLINLDIPNSMLPFKNLGFQKEINTLNIMDTIPNDLIKRIFSLLSSNENLFMREVSLSFKRNTNPILLILNKLDNLLKISHPVEMILTSHLTCYLSYNNFTIFKMKDLAKIHSLFSMNIATSIAVGKFNSCIDESCREKKLGFLYFLKKQMSPLNGIAFYNKRDIPYCSQCYKYWNM